MKERYVHFAWMVGLGWVKYPLQVPMFGQVKWVEAGPPFDDVYDGIVLVWIGPAAPLPAKVKLDPPRPVYTQIPHDDLSYPGWQSWHAKKVIDPSRGCAWVYEVEPQNASGWCRVLWKVWDYDIH